MVDLRAARHSWCMRSGVLPYRAYRPHSRNYLRWLLRGATRKGRGRRGCLWQVLAVAANGKGCRGLPPCKMGRGRAKHNALTFKTSHVHGEQRHMCARSSAVRCGTLSENAEQRFGVENGFQAVRGAARSAGRPPWCARPGPPGRRRRTDKRQLLFVRVLGLHGLHGVLRGVAARGALSAAPRLCGSCARTRIAALQYQRQNGTDTKPTSQKTHWKTFWAFTKLHTVTTHVTTTGLRSEVVNR